MDDIASRLGVSKGTVYGSVDSKEPRLAAVPIYGDTPRELPDAGPLDSIGLAQVSSTVRDAPAQAVADLELAAVVAGPPTRRAP